MTARRRVRFSKSCRATGMVLADTAYDATEARMVANSRGGRAKVPPRRNRRDPIRFSPFLYRDRNRIERFFNRIEHCRRSAIRCEKRADNVLAVVKLAAIRRWLRAYESTA